MRLVSPVVRGDVLEYPNPSSCTICIAIPTEANTLFLPYHMGVVSPGIGDTYSHSMLQCLQPLW